MLTVNEQTLAAAWLSRFGTPLPVLGCEALARFFAITGSTWAWARRGNRWIAAKGVLLPHEAHDGGFNRAGQR